MFHIIGHTLGTTVVPASHVLRALRPTVWWGVCVSIGVFLSRRFCGEGSLYTDTRAEVVKWQTRKS